MGSSPRRPLIDLALGVIALGAILAGACTLAGFGGRLWWSFDLCANFRVQYALGLLAATAAFVAARRDRAAAACAAGVAINLAVIAPLFWSGGDDPGAGAERVRVVSYNVNTSNTHFDEVIAFLRERDADVIAVLEIDDEWDRRLRGAFSDYRADGEWRSDNFGILVLSRLPVVASQVVELAGANVPGIDMTVTVGGRDVSVLALHTVPPVRSDWSARRDAMIAAVGDWVHSHNFAIVLGDLNATPWSAPFRALLSETRLESSQRGYGLEPTWPAGMPFLGVAIDHVLVTPGLAVVGRGRGPFLGSDHRPLVVDIAIGE